MRRSAVSLLIALLAGCAAGPDFQRPATPPASQYTTEPLAVTAASEGPGGAAQRFVASDVPAEWWQLFRSPALDSLVRRALAANPNIEAARAALRVAQENAAAQRGAYAPQVSASLTPTRQKIADALSSPLNSNATLFSLHTAQVSVGYTADIFGGNRRQVESLEAQAEAQAYELEAARQSLAANVVAAAIQDAALREQIAAVECIVALNEGLLDDLRRQVQHGAIAESAVVGQQAALAQAQAILPPLRKQLGQNRDLLSALTGSLPDSDATQPFALAGFELPVELPVALPSQLVEHRPDVRAAEAQAHAASAQIGVAAAAHLPQFTLTADIGSVASRGADLFKAGSGFWSLAGGIAQPLFTGGTLKHRQRAAEAAYDQAVASYRATVIGAFQNVADVLQALRYDADALRAADAAERATADNLAIVRRQVALGDAAGSALLNAEQTWQQASLGRIQAQAARLSDSAALLQSLGGGWWNRGNQANDKNP